MIGIRRSALLWRAALWRSIGAAGAATARFCMDRADALERRAADLLERFWR